MKIDPYNTKERYLAWKGREDKLSEISPINKEILLQYLNDMEIGINGHRSAKRGSRSYIHLMSLKDRLVSIMKKLKELYGIEDILKVNEEQIFLFFSNLRSGAITKPNGQKYMCVRDYVKVFKAFWHWHQRINSKKGIELPDITLDLDTKEEKPDWVYLTEEQVKKLADNARYDYKILILFLFDTGIRAPTELMNIRVSDFYNDFKELNIRQEVSKTFGRRIKLMICSSLVKEYVESRNLNHDDVVFDINFTSTNKYLKRLAKSLFGDEKSQAGQRYSDLTLYDFRHCSCCYWLIRYKSESALKYRFGWKESDKIHYYSELLGMKDTIAEDDLLVDLTKTEIEQRLEKFEKENGVLSDRVKYLEGEIDELKKISLRLIQVSPIYREQKICLTPTEQK